MTSPQGGREGGTLKRWHKVTGGGTLFLAEVTSTESLKFALSKSDPLLSICTVENFPTKMILILKFIQYFPYLKKFPRYNTLNHSIIEWGTIHLKFNHSVLKIWGGVERRCRWRHLKGVGKLKVTWGDKGREGGQKIGFLGWRHLWMVPKAEESYKSW